MFLPAAWVERSAVQVNSALKISAAGSVRQRVTRPPECQCKPLPSQVLAELLWHVHDAFPQSIRPRGRLNHLSDVPG